MSDVSRIATDLSKASVNDEGILSFVGKGLKLDKADDAAEIVKEIENFKNLLALKLEGNTMGVDAAEVIGKALEKHPEFKRALWSDMFTGRLKTEIPQALEHLGNGIMKSGAQLVELDLSDNAFGPNGIVGCVPLLESKSCYTLKELKLNNNGLGVTGGKMLAKSLLACHKASVEAGTPLALTTFISGRGRLEDEGAKNLAEAFKAMGSLEHVSMTQNGIRSDGIAALADAFAVNKKLKIINLNDNTFSESGGIAMAKTLPHLNDLEVINFGDCLVRTGGAIAIANSLKHGHVKLKELILSGNEIKKSGALAIANCLGNKTSLEKVELGANNFGEAGVEEITDVFETLNKGHILQSLSDDEGSEDEDDDVEDGILRHSIEDDSIEDVKEGEISKDPTLQIKGKAIQIPTEAVSVHDFMTFPSAAKLLGIGSDRAAQVVEYMQDDIEDPQQCVTTAMKISSVVTLDQDDVKVAAAECVDELFSRLFSSDDSVVSINAVNSILEHLGLIKSEGKIKAVRNITGPLLVLEHCVKKSYFPKLGKDILQAFLSKPTPGTDGSSKAKHLILQTLYQY